jgi:raffinose/stachyose/melibiose transport system permease protein
MKNKGLTKIKLIILCLFSITTLFPFVWVLLSSFKTNSEIFSKPISLPENWLFTNYIAAWKSANIPISFGNSLFYSLVAIAITMLLTCMTAYAIMRVYYSHIAFIFFSLGITIPLHALIIPLNMEFNMLGLLNTRFSIIIAYIIVGMSLSFFIMAAYMRTIPKELDEAASIDGCSRTRAFFFIILPICKPAIATASTLQFINCWNDLLLCLTLVSKEELRTLNLAVYSMRANYVSNYGVITAGIILLVLPAILIYMLFQEQIIKGMVSGAVKG